MDLDKEENNLNRSNSELYKELETINFESVLQKTKVENDKRISSSIRRKVGGNKAAWVQNEKSLRDPKKIRNQFTLFQGSMKLLIIFGQVIGLNPVFGILENDVQKMSFKVCSFKCMYSIMMCGFQTLATFLCIVRLCRHVISIDILAFVSFYFTTAIVTLLFIRIAKKWPGITQEICHSKLDEYIDTKVIFKCKVVAIGFLAACIVEHIFGQLVVVVDVIDCYYTPGQETVYEKFFFHSFTWLYEVGVPNVLPVGIIVLILNFISTITWNYLDVFIICVSLYLTSILEKVDEKINATYDMYHPPSFWRSLREDYTRATRLIRIFDENISGIILTSFANNLFFICLQLFNLLRHGLSAKPPQKECPNYPSGPFNGYESVVYFIFSFCLVFSRFLAVSLIASRVHCSAKKPSLALYGVPTHAYCTEVQRFLEQIQSDDVALSGLQFFQITRSLVLTVAATIVTYELVLLQLNGENNGDITKGAKGPIGLGSQTLRFEEACKTVCSDLPADDLEPVCMMFSRYKKGYQFFMNLCHARRAICKENLILHMVHPSRCMKTNQFFMPVS